MFIPIKNIPMLRSEGQAASSITRGNAVVFSSAGYIDNASATSTDIVGVAAETYDNSAGAANAVDILYWPCFADVIFQATTASTTPAQTDVGETFDLASVSTVNPGASSYSQVLGVEYINTTTIGVSFVDTIYGANAT